MPLGVVDSLHKNDSGKAEALSKDRKRKCSKK
jgi:hypothetical protein